MSFKKNKNFGEMYKIYVKTSAVGLEFFLSVALGAFFGYLIKKNFIDSNWPLIIGVIIGSIAGFKRLYTFSKNYLKNKDDGQKD